MKYSEVIGLLARRGNEVQGMHLGLHRMVRVLAALGEPHCSFPVVHIAGTNGKGSVAAMSESILRHAGWKTGLYTSPHLQRVEERIRVDNQVLGARRLGSIASRVAAAEEALLKSRQMDRPLTYFEFLTACAFDHFAASAVEIAVVEVGLGGRLDATNVVRPQVCAITGVSYDHKQILGSTIREIAFEKAGIIKPGVTVISGCRVRAARATIANVARARRAPLLEVARDFDIEILRRPRGHCIINLVTPSNSYRRLRLGLAGSHQAWNAAVAVGAVELLQGFAIRPSDVRSGLAAAEWPGRMDFYDARRRTLLDGAHNPEGAEMLRNYLLDQNEKEVHLVFGIMGDKDAAGIGSRLFPLATRIHLTPLANPRSMQPSDLTARFPRARDRMNLHSCARDALHAAWKGCPANGLVVVTGSLYLIGELIETVRKESGRRS
jgi:dihydrofolate synthase / folylpolyglutamate synthase